MRNYASFREETDRWSRMDSIPFPVRKPLPKGLKGTNPMPSSFKVGNTSFSVSKTFTRESDVS